MQPPAQRHKNQLNDCGRQTVEVEIEVILSCYLHQTLKKHINHVYQNQTCIDVIDVGVSAFSECFLLLLILL